MYCYDKRAQPGRTDSSGDRPDSTSSTYTPPAPKRGVVGCSPTWTVRLTCPGLCCGSSLTQPVHRGLHPVLWYLPPCPGFHGYAGTGCPRGDALYSVVTVEPLIPRLPPPPKGNLPHCESRAKSQDCEIVGKLRSCSVGCNVLHLQHATCCMLHPWSPDLGFGGWGLEPPAQSHAPGTMTGCAAIPVQYRVISRI